MRNTETSDSHPFSRRDFLKLAGVQLLLAAILDSCGPVGRVIATATRPTPTTGAPINDATPAAPIIDVGGVKVPDPKSTNPEFFDSNNPNSAVVQCADAFGVTADKIVDSTPGLFTDLDGKQFVVLTAGSLVSTIDPTIAVTDPPLLIAIKNDQQAWVWSIANGKRLGERIGILIGTSVGDREGPTNQTYRNVASGDFSVLFADGFYSNDLVVRPEDAQSYTELANQAGDMLYIQPGIWVEDQEYLSNCKSKNEVITGIKARAAAMMAYIDPKKNIAGKPTYVNIHNEAFYYFLDAAQGISLGWKNSTAHKFLGRDVLVETYLAFLEVAKERGFEVGKDIVFTFSEAALDVDNAKTKMALTEYTYTKSQIAKRLNVAGNQVRISFAFQGRYDANNPYDQTSNRGGASDNGRWHFPGKDLLVANRGKFKSLFDQLLFTETAFENYTPEQRRDNIKQYLEAAKEIGAAMVIFEAPLRSNQYQPGISAENVGLYTASLKKTAGYYAFMSDMLSVAN